MNEITRWFESMGVSPLLGGVIIGAIVVFLLTRRSDRNVQPLGATTGPPPAERRQNSMSGAHTQIRIENNGQPIDLSAAVVCRICSTLGRTLSSEARSTDRARTTASLAGSHTR